MYCVTGTSTTLSIAMLHLCLKPPKSMHMLVLLNPYLSFDYVLWGPPNSAVEHAIYASDNTEDEAGGLSQFISYISSEVGRFSTPKTRLMVVQCEQGKEKVGLGRPIMLALSRRLVTVVAWGPMSVPISMGLPDSNASLTATYL